MHLFDLVVLEKQFQEDKLTFSESFLNGHTLRKLPNLRPDQVDELEIDGNTSCLLYTSPSPRDS